MDQQVTAEGRVPSRPFNWRAATLACATVFLAVQAYVFGHSKTCVTHFDFNLMFSWVLVGLFIDWIVWMPIGGICGWFAGRHVPQNSRFAHIALTVILVIAPIAAFAMAFSSTTYTVNRYACFI